MALPRRQLLPGETEDQAQNPLPTSQPVTLGGVPQDSTRTQPPQGMDLASIKALLDQYKPSPVSANLPPPQMPQGMDPEVVRNTLQRASTLGIVHGMLGTHTPSTYEVMRSGSAAPTVPPSPAYDAARANIMAPLEAEKARVSVLNQQGEVQNKYNLENTKLGLETGKANNAIPLAELKGMLSAWAGTQKNQTLRDVAQTNADAKPKVLSVPMGGQATSNQTGKPLGPVNTGTASGGIDPGVIDREADRYNATGNVQTPKGLRGPMAMGFVQQVMNRAQEKLNGTTAPAKPLASASADYRADTATQSKLQQQASTTNAREDTALKNLDVFLGTAQKVTDTGSPALNKPMRWLDENMGDPNIAAFRAARQTAVSEISQVLNNSGSQMTDSMRHEINDLIGPNATGAQVTEAAKILKQDMMNRRAANQHQIDVTRERIAGPQSSNSAPVTIRRKRDGTTKTLSSDAAAKYLSSPDFEKVQ